TLDLRPEGNGYFRGSTLKARAGTLYTFRLDDDDYAYPDPVSRFQPEGPHGPSQVVDPAAFQWTDDNWQGLPATGQVLYEMHVGTFTPEGTWDAARRQLTELASAGITGIEIMPIADFGGRWGWGYDGVDLFAPTRVYGSPDDVRRFIDDAHRAGIGVILDVVYNHLGPDGNYLKAFADDYFTDAFTTDWGEAINFACEPVREFYLSNVAYWIEEFHFDGLRLDATQDIHDSGPEHILGAIAKKARQAAGRKSVYLVGENEPQDTQLVRAPETGGFGMDALWNDDFHHSALVAMTGRNEAYYTDYRGDPQEFVSSAKYGYLYQGQRYKWQEKRRGTPALDLPAANFVTFIQNHDQVANSAHGDRPNVLTHPGRYRAMSALLMLGPGTPMLFQGQEFGATNPFLYFCDHESGLCDQVAKGRREFLAQFRSLAQPELQSRLDHPGNPSTFERSKLDFSERERNAAVYALYKDLIRLRRSIEYERVDGAVLSASAFVLRYVASAGNDALLLVNLGRDLHLNPAPEPLLAPPWRKSWAATFSTEDPRYGGTGTFPPDSEDNWRIAGHSAIFLQAVNAKNE
ncbi:MAG TPA: malto-oligosyltrehalose trehalohydrolase, partial [Bryobacteraceae bacterium]|nr:malto-oligosyltrehalose trehalohydrolase [Bryobacteraceae bacterium]